jgi:hypothetical protein
MWKAITLVASTAFFSLLGLLVQWNRDPSERAMAALLGSLFGFLVGYLSIAVAVSSDRPK